MIDQNTDLQAARAELERDRTALDQREIEIETESIVRLDKAHAALIPECRSAQDRLTEISLQCDDAQEDWQRSENAAGLIDLAIRDHLRDKPRNYPLPDEISKWESGLATLSDKRAKACNVIAAKWERLEGLRAERQKLHSAFENLKTREQESRQEIGYRRAELAKREPRKPLGKFEVVDGARLVSA